MGLESGCRGESVMLLHEGAFQAAGSLSLEPPLLPPGLINNSDVVIKTVSFRQCSKPKR